MWNFMRYTLPHFKHRDMWSALNVKCLSELMCVERRWLMRMIASFGCCRSSFCLTATCTQKAVVACDVSTGTTSVCVHVQSVQFQVMSCVLLLLIKVLRLKTKWRLLLLSRHRSRTLFDSCCKNILLPLGLIWTVMLIWRKGNINRTVSVL